MTEEYYQDIKGEYLKNIKSIISETGGLQPHVTVFAVKRSDDDESEEDSKIEKNAIIHIPVPSKFMDSERGKDLFVNKMIPEIAVELNKRFETQGVAWAAEGWFREAHVDDFDPEVDDYKELPIKKEVVIISIESDTHNDCYVYELKRNGKQVNSDGAFIDIIELVEMIDAGEKPVSGRFTGLYKKFLNPKKYD